MSLNVITVKLILYFQSRFLKNLCSGTQCGGFQFLLILDLWGKSFNAVVVFGLSKNLLFKSVLGHCYIWKKNNHPSSKPSKSNLFAFMNQFCWWIKILCTLIMLWNPTNFEAIFLLKICSRLAILLWICDDFTSLENLTEDGVFPYITVVSI